MDDIFFDMFISYNDLRTEAYLNIRPNSRIDKKNLKKSLQEAYKKVKLSLKLSELSYGIISDKEIMTNLKRYVLMSDEERKKDIYTFLLAKGREPIDGEDSKLIIHIDLNKKKSGKIDPKTGQVDHKDLGFSERVIPKSTKIATIIKPTEGIHGIKVNGEVIKAEPGKLIHKIKFDKNSIEEKEEEKEINYYSTKEGFLYQDSRKGFFVDSNILVKSVDYSIGNIDADDVDSTSVIVRGKSDVTEDTIKSGFKVEAKNINVTGNVGIEAEIIGENITINGITDKNSKLIGKNIKIKKAFNNYVEGENIDVNEVNGAKIVGDNIIVKNSISGNINGSEIVILKESRGSSIVFEKFLFILSAIGSAKQFISIDPLFSDKRKEIYRQLKIKRNETKKIYEEIYLKYQLEQEKHKKNEKLVEKLIENYFNLRDDNKKKAIKQIFSSGKWNDFFAKYNIELPIHDEDKIHKYCASLKKFLNMESQFKQIEAKYREIEKKVEDVETAHLNSKIIILKLQSPIIIKFKDRKFTYNERFTEPIKITFITGKPKIEEFSIKEMKNYETLLSKNIYGVLKSHFRF